MRAGRLVMVAVACIACARRLPPRPDAARAMEAPAAPSPSVAPAADGPEWVMVPIPGADEAPRDRPIVVALPAIPSKTFPRPAGAPALAGCSGFFPTEANVDVARVVALVTVEATGVVGAVSIVEVDPPSEKVFGKAARTCLLRGSYRAAIDPDGQPKRATMMVKLRFAR